MKIIFLTDDFPPISFGGAGIIAYRDALALKKLGHDIEIITTVQKKEDEGIVQFKGLKLYRFYSSYDEKWRAYKSIFNRSIYHKVERIILEKKADIIHAHNIHSHISYAMLKIAKKSGAKVFLTAHDLLSVHYGKLYPDKVGSYKFSSFELFCQYKWRFNPLRNMFIRHYFKYIDCVFTVSHEVEKVLNAHGINNTETLHNGIDVHDWCVEKNDINIFRRSHSLCDKTVLLFAGRLSRAKGIDSAMGLVEKIYLKNKNVCLFIVGRDDNEEALRIKKRAKEMSIENAIIFSGWLGVDDMKKAMFSADIVLVLSRYLDPFPNINLEAMASEKPVIGTCYGGTKEAIKDGSNGFIVDPYDDVEVYNKTLELIENRDKSIVFGRNGYKALQDGLTEDIHIEKLLLCYNRKS